MSNAMSSPPTKKQKKPLFVPPTVPEGWDRCHAYMERKSRFCRQEILPSLKATGQFYCGNHRHLSSSSSHHMKGIHRRQENSIYSNTCNVVRKRIACPVDPTHHIYEDMLEKHIPKCPKTVELRKQQQNDFYNENCNCGGYGFLNNSIISQCKNNDVSLHRKWRENEDEFNFAKRVATMVLKSYHKIFIATRTNNTDISPKKCNGSNLENSNDDITQISQQDILDSIPLLDLSQLELDSGFEASVTDYRIKSGGIRHMRQQASMVGHLRRIGVLEANTNGISTTAQNNDKYPMPTFSRTILEMGAGRGMTGLVVAGVSAMNTNAKTHLTMIERSASRSRAEKFLRKVKQYTSSYPTTTSCTNYMNLSSIEWSRIHCDLSHVSMKTVLDQIPNFHATNDEEESQSSPRQDVVVIAKHLCGVGTDLALKSIEPIKDDLTACIMSTCCHGVCSWDDYVGRNFLAELMVDDKSILSSFSEKEFDYLRLWSSGTVRDTSTTKSNESTYLNTSDDEDTINDEHNQEKEIKINGNTVNVTSVVEALQLKCTVQGFGRACQRLIDYGRCEYIRHVLFNNTTSKDDNVELIYYVNDSITPQNALLLAYR